MAVDVLGEERRRESRFVMEPAEAQSAWLQALILKFTLSSSVPWMRAKCFATLNRWCRAGASMRCGRLGVLSVFILVGWMQPPCLF